MSLSQAEVTSLLAMLIAHSSLLIAVRRLGAAATASIMTTHNDQGEE